MRISYGIIGLLITNLTPLISGCSKFLYNVNVANYGEYGVIFLKIPTTRTNAHKRKNPGIPGVRDDIGHFGKFHDHPHSLPDQVVVERQLAELSDCRSVRVYSKDPQYVRKRGCTWTPLEDKVFRKVFDLRDILKSEHANRAGERIRLGSKRVMTIMFIFRDEDVALSVGSRRTNAFK